MKYQPELAPATLIKRYKRFLADIDSPVLGEITIHCPNTGSMKNCAEPGWRVWYSTSDNAKRKYPQTWELVETDAGTYIGINTGMANKLVKEAIENGVVTQLQGYDSIKPEVKYGQENSRIDLLLSGEGKPDCYVEIKSVTLLESDGIGYFPDAVSERGRKHLRELIEMKRAGHRAVLFYCVQHTGITSVTPATHIDPAYAETLAEAVAAGVEVYAYGCKMSQRENFIDKALPFAVASTSIRGNQ